MYRLFTSKIFKKQFLSYVLLIFTTFAVISALLFSTTNRSLRKQQLYLVENYRRQASNSIQSWLNDKKQFVKSQALYAGKLAEAGESDKKILDTVRKQLAWNDNYLNFSLITENGIAVNTAGESEIFDLSKREYYLKGIRGESSITGFYGGAKTGTPVMAIGEPVYVEGKIKYIFAAFIKLEKVKQIVETQNFGDWGHAYLVDNERTFITDSRFVKEFINGIINKEQYKINTAAVEDLMKMRAGTKMYKDFMGENVFGSYEWLDLLQVGLIVEFRESEVMQPITQQLELLSLLAVLVGIMGIFLAFTMSKRLIMPVEAIISSIEKFIDRRDTQPISIKTNTELDRLVGHFNNMKAAIKLREEQLQAKNKELKIQTAEALEATKLKSQFLANMSHELRTPLNSIIGFTTRVIKKSGDVLPEIQRENLDIVRQEAIHLLELINDLLDYSKIEAGKMDLHMEEFNLHDVISEVYNIIKPIADEKGLKYEVSCYAPANIPVLSDRIKVKQILINLLSNACKYSDSGKVRLSVTETPFFYKIAVEDEGIGIGTENLGNIFDEFRQVDGSYTRKVGGTGLGLSITKKFLDMLGGRIEVESELGRGSCFTVYIPIQSSVPTGSEILPSLAGGTQQRGDKTVVCIDDDPNVQRLYKQYLNEQGYEIISFDGCGDVIAVIKDIMPNVIILDIILPEKDGWDILANLKKDPVTKKIPIIMASVLSEENIAYKMGADEYLVKPVTQDELIETVISTIDKKAGIDIIVADDDENYLNLMGQFLREEEISYRLARNGEEALALITEKKPDLLVLDIMMPVKDGFSVMEQMKKNPSYKDIHTIVVTAKSLSTKEKEELQARANRVIQKSGTHIDQVMQAIIERLKEKNANVQNSGRGRPAS